MFCQRIQRKNAEEKRSLGEEEIKGSNRAPHVEETDDGGGEDEDKERLEEGERQKCRQCFTAQTEAAAAAAAEEEKEEEEEEEEEGGDRCSAGWTRRPSVRRRPAPD
ncbi:uncharacterized protein V6R79_010676 [Siganus canaliculatus]